MNVGIAIGRLQVNAYIKSEVLNPDTEYQQCPTAQSDSDSTKIGHCNARPAFNKAKEQTDPCKRMRSLTSTRCGDVNNPVL